MTDKEFNTLPKDIRQQYVIKQLKESIEYLTKELNLYKKYCARPVILKEVIHHPVCGRDSQCLYGKPAYDTYVYE